MQTDQFNHGPAAAPRPHRQPEPRLRRRSARGSPTAWARRTRTCPASSCCSPAGTFPTPARACGARGFLPVGLPGRAVPLAGRSGAVPRRTRRASTATLRGRSRRHDRRHRTAARTPRLGDPETAHPHRPVRAGLPHADVGVPTRWTSPTSREHIHALYATEPGKESFANNCLLARRLVERGVRFVQLFDWGWDSHGARSQRGAQRRLHETSAGRSTSRSPRC